ncbi:MAG TPA: hypothetical protein VMJ35_05325 [Dongiaceae bacterium]|nr:hypothetical protein [Dongiaceae bacterium]
MSVTESFRPAGLRWKKGVAQMEEMQELSVISLEGPVIRKDGRLMLLIPLAAGGEELKDCSRGISEVAGDCLKIVLPEWLAGMLRVEEGDLVNINNLNGKFNISAVKSRPVH